MVEEKNLRKRLNGTNCNWVYRFRGISMKEKRGRKFVQFQLQSMANLGQWELQWKRQFLVATNATVIQRVLTLSVTKMCNKGDYWFSVFNGFGRFSCFWTLFVFKGLLSFLLLSNEKVTSSSPHVLHSLLCCDKYIPENIVWLWRPPTTKSDLTNMP